MHVVVTGASSGTAPLAREFGNHLARTSVTPSRGARAMDDLAKEVAATCNVITHDLSDRTRATASDRGGRGARRADRRDDQQRGRREHGLGLYEADADAVALIHTNAIAMLTARDPAGHD
jgi:hypothetical protein